MDTRLISEESAWQTYFAVDLGASSGRVMIVRTDGRKLQIETAHRFPNHPTRISDHLYWDLPRLLDEVKDWLAEGIQISPRCKSFAIDTWGIDFGLITKEGSFSGPPIL